jgi:hypothetical protein
MTATHNVYVTTVAVYLVCGAQSCQVAIAWQPSSDPVKADVQSNSAADMPGYRHATPTHQVMHMVNVQQQLYPAGQLSLHPESQLQNDSPGWFRYTWAAYKVRLWCCT